MGAKRETISTARGRGFVKGEELKKEGKFPTPKELEEGPTIVIECVEGIPCDPCAKACPVGAISKKSLSTPPRVNHKECIGCAKCIQVCPGLAIFKVVYKDHQAEVTLPYELDRVPEKGEEVMVLNRQGEPLGTYKVSKVRNSKEDTKLITVEVTKDLAMEARAIRKRDTRGK